MAGGTAKAHFCSGLALVLAAGCLTVSATASVETIPSIPHDLEGDPANYRTMNAVCGSCHGIEVFTDTPRTWNRWTDIFESMTRHGLQATEEEVDQVVDYFLANMTLVNVNSSPAEELAVALGVGDAVSAQIVARRAQRKFSNMGDLAAFPGVDAQLLKRRASRIEF